ncbi:MAG: hypothetical protein WB696_21935 [Chthoniobacterales bacterium]
MSWLRNPEAPINQIPLNFAEERDRPSTKEEIQKTRDSLMRHAPDNYLRMFGSGPSCFLDRSFHVAGLLGGSLYRLMQFQSLITKNKELGYKDSRLHPSDYD